MTANMHKARNAGTPWSDSDRQLLARLYPDESNPTLAKIFGRSAASIKNEAIKLGLHKSTEFMATGPGQFKAGNRTWNKGMKGLDIGGKNTRFQKGHRPANWKPIGHEMDISGYLNRKVSDDRSQRDNYRPVQQLVWEEYMGKPVPEGHTVIFRDSDKRNFYPGNLELISRAELMRRNSHHTNLPPELAQIIQLRGAITRKINRRRRMHEKQS